MSEGYVSSGLSAKTADGTVGTSGARQRVFSVTWLSGGTAGTLVLRNGSDASGTIYVSAAGTINKTVTMNFEGGLVFPDGCFYDHDSNTTIALIMHSQEV